MTYSVQIESRDTRSIKLTKKNRRMIYPDCGCWIGYPGYPTLFDAWHKIEELADELESKGYTYVYSRYCFVTVMRSSRNHEKVIMTIKVE